MRAVTVVFGRYQNETVAEWIVGYRSLICIRHFLAVVCMYIYLLKERRTVLLLFWTLSPSNSCEWSCCSENIEWNKARLSVRQPAEIKGPWKWNAPQNMKWVPPQNKTIKCYHFNYELILYKLQSIVNVSITCLKPDMFLPSGVLILRDDGVGGDGLRHFYALETIA